VGVRFRDFLGSMTYFVPTSYSGEGGLSKSVERSELDINVGYFIMPSVLLSIGYKKGKIDRISDRDDIDTEQNIDAILVGLSATAPLTDRLSLYGNFAYGFGRTESEQKDARREDSYDSRYAIGELGVSMRLFESSPNAFLKSASASIGYRVQSYTIDGSGFGTYAGPIDLIPLSTTKQDIRTSTNGVVLALIATF